MVTVTVSKIDSSVTMAPEITNPTYSGKAQKLVTAGTAEGGTMQYSLDGESYSKAIPTGTDAKEYTVWYKVVGDENHSDTEPAYITVTISPKELTVRAMDKGIEVGEAVPDLSKPTLGEDYTVDGLVGSDTLTTAPKLVYSSKPDNTKAGTYAITASGADAGEDYTIDYASGTLTISKKQPNPDPTPTKKGTLTFNLNGGTLDGKTGKLTIKAKVGDTITIPDAPTRKGYTFQYWKGSRYNPGDKYEVVGDHTFTAMWTKNSGSGTNGSRSTRSTSGATRRRVTPNTGDVSVGTASLAALTAAGLCLVARGLRLKTH